MKILFIPDFVIVILLTIIGMWCITDGWFSISLYLKDKNQTWRKDHYIRIIRILIGVLAIFIAWYIGMVVSCYVR
jgi:uncharacterized membrane protein HdeD (DUF308 family)